MSSTIMTLARLAAIKAVNRDMRAKGLHVGRIERRVITAVTDVYLTQHPELIDAAAESVRKVPQLRTLYEREMHQCRRNQW